MSEGYRHSLQTILLMEDALRNPEVQKVMTLDNQRVFTNAKDKLRKNMKRLAS